MAMKPASANVPATRCRCRLAALALGALFSLAACGYGDFVTYEGLPEEPTRYTLEVKTGDVTTKWEYISQRADEPNSPENQHCLIETANKPDKGGCRPEGLIFLKHDLGLRLDNTVQIGPPHRINIIGYYEDRLDSPPEVTEAGVEVTYDGGTTWQEVSTVAAGENAFTATIYHQPGAETVGLRVSAADSDGNTVVQTMPEAYRLALPSSPAGAVTSDSSPQR